MNISKSKKLKFVHRFENLYFGNATNLSAFLIKRTWYRRLACVEKKNKYRRDACATLLITKADAGKLVAFLKRLNFDLGGIIIDALRVVHDISLADRHAH